MNKKGISTILVVAIIVAFIIFVGGYFLLSKKGENQPPGANTQREQIIKIIPITAL